jgi:HEAT repeat protein
MKRHLTIGLAAIAGCVLVGWVAHWWIARPLRYQGRSLEAWSMQFSYSPDPKLRDQAGAIIQALGAKAVPGLMRLLQTQDPLLKEKAWALGPSLPRAWRRLVLRSLKPPEAAAVRVAAARSLGLVGAEAHDAVPLLARCLRDQQGSVRWDAANALSRIGPEAVPLLGEALQDPNAQVRRAAATALSQMHGQAESTIPALVRCLGDESEQVQIVAVDALSAIGKPAVPALVEAIEHGQGPARQGAAAALMKVYPSPRVAEGPLLKLLLDESPSARQQAINFLTSMRDTQPAVVAAFTAALNDPVLEVRLAAAQALASAGSRAESAVRELTELLKDPSPLLRAAGARALGQIGAGAKSALPELARLAADHVEEVRAAAAEAQARIQAKGSVD